MIMKKQIDCIDWCWLHCCLGGVGGAKNICWGMGAKNSGGGGGILRGKPGGGGVMRKIGDEN